MQSLNNLNVSNLRQDHPGRPDLDGSAAVGGTGNGRGREAPVGVFVTYTDVNGLVHNGLPIMPRTANETGCSGRVSTMFDPAGNSRNWQGTKVGKGAVVYVSV